MNNHWNWLKCGTGLTLAECDERLTTLAGNSSAFVGKVQTVLSACESKERAGEALTELLSPPTSPKGWAEVTINSIAKAMQGASRASVGNRFQPILERAQNELNQPATASVAPCWGGACAKAAARLIAGCEEIASSEPELRKQLEQAAHAAGMLGNLASLWEYVISICCEILADRRDERVSDPLRLSTEGGMDKEDGGYWRYATKAWKALARHCLSVKPVGTVRFPVASVTRERDGKAQLHGRIEEFEVSVFRENISVAAPHPLQAGDGEEQFRIAAANAWRTACRLATEEGVFGDEVALFKTAFGTWCRIGGADVPFDGHSAGGALALAWYRALRGQKYDPRVVVFATISDNGALCGFGNPQDKSCQDSISAKVEAVLRHGGIDTIATVSDHIEQIENLLSGQDAVSVVNIADNRRSEPKHSTGSTRSATTR